MIDDLITICEINSHAYNTEGVNQVAEFLINKYQKSFTNIEVEKIKLDNHKVINDRAELENKALGNLVFIKKHVEKPVARVMLMGHLDTVFPPSSHFQKCKHLDDKTINGPGVADLKGGLLVMHKALEELEAKAPDKISWTVVFNPDEEIGSPQSQLYFEELAKNHDIGMIYEPSLSDGSIAWRRKGTGNFQLVARGKAAHVGREFSKGKSAIFALAQFIQEANKLNSPQENIIINFGKISGGGALNSVPETAVLGINIRTENLEDEKIALDHLNSIIEKMNQEENLELTLHGKLNRKPKIPNEKMEKLYAAFLACAQELNLEFAQRNTGGCCDGNNFHEYGLVNLDTLGVRGGNIHSDQEFICTDSLEERSSLSALFLVKLASGQVTI